MSDTEPVYAGHRVITNGADGLPVDPTAPLGVRSATRQLPDPADGDPASVVPAGAKDVIAWIREPDDVAEAARRADLAEVVEGRRDDGARATVTAAISAAREAAQSAADSPGDSGAGDGTGDTVEGNRGSGGAGDGTGADEQP